MRLLKLDIHNITSIADSTIDFENSILSQEPLFLICGETGAGKSTILNCICMALYNQVPSMPGSHERYEGRLVGDLSNFLRKGTGEGYIHLLFEESGQRYEADWMVRRAHNKPDGKLQNIERLLKNAATKEVLATKVNEMDKQIQQLIGLDFDRFTRMFMLAQGQFNKFLTADEKEKSAILESLTQMDVYNKTGKYIHDKMVNVYAQLSKVKQQIEDIQLLTDEEKTEKKQQISLTNIEIETLDKEIKTADKKINWWQSMQRFESELENSRAAFNKYPSQLSEIKVGLALQQDLLKEQEADWDRLKKDEATYENQQTIVAELHTIVECNNNNITLRQSNKTLEQKLATEKDQLEEIKKQGVAASANAEEQKKLFEAKQKEIEQAGKDALLSKRNELSAQLTDIETASAKWQVAHTAETALTDTLNKVDTLKAEYDQLKKDYKTRAEEFNAAQASYVERQRIFETQQLTIQECARQLRKSLEEGKPCPICGSTHHDISTEEVFDSLFEKVKTERDQAEKIKNEAQRRLTAVKTSLELKEKETSKVRAITLVQQKTNKEKADKEWLPFSEKYCKGILFESCPETLAKEKQVRSTEIAQIDEKLKAIKGIESDALLLQKSKEQTDKVYQNLKEEYIKQTNLIERSQAEKAHNEALIASNLKTIEEKNKNIDSLITWNDWHQRWIDNSMQFEQQLVQEGKRYIEYKFNLPLRRKAIDTIQTAIDSSEHSIGTIKEMMPEWNGETDSESYPIAANIENNGIELLQKKVSTLNNDLLLTLGKIRQLKDSLQQLQEQTDKPTEEENLAALSKLKEEKDILKGEKQRIVGSLQQQIDNDAAHQTDRIKLLEERDKQKSIYDNWVALDTMFGLDRFSKAAQQITFRFLLGKANQHLHNLYPRYNLLCAPDSFALAVEDYEMGTSRPCTTLSGGESFIVSLALALGLSSLSDEKIKVDTLFIDEGFGTLSAEYLDTVMKVLEGLQRTGRKVGIISHVEILRERIPAQIQVIRTSRTESKIIVAG